MTYFHYTSRLGAQDINGSQSIRTGRDGLVYLTDVEYRAGAAASSMLAITGKPVDVAAVLDVGQLSLEGPELVELVRHPLSGHVLRPGGGREFTAGANITGEAIRCWITLEWP